jgi:putative zinc finger/helix-turn-helix YgiT family protein
MRSFPRTCADCRTKKVVAATIDHEIEIKHDGNLHKVMVRALPVEKCEACGEFTIGNDGDIRIDEALREHLGLLMPSQIREKRKALGLTQEVLASAIGCASESISRWESGAVVQSCVMDKWLRAYFDLPELRAYFGGQYSKVSHDAQVVQWSELFTHLCERLVSAPGSMWPAVTTGADMWPHRSASTQALRVMERTAYGPAMPTTPYLRLVEQPDVAA